MDSSIILWGGALAGFTIFLGLPVARARVSENLRILLTATSVGILLYLFVEISYHGIEQIESTVKLMSLGYRSLEDFVILTAIFVGGFSLSLLSLLFIETRFMRNGSSPLKTAILIAFGIGLHNFSEGLVIGQQLATGGLALGALLVTGFALHNATEGFGIAAPLANQQTPLWILFLLGLLGGGPTLAGTIVGSQWTSERFEALFLAVAAGAILYVVGELIHIGRARGIHRLSTFGLLIGFFLAFFSDLLIESAATSSFLKTANQMTLQMQAADYFFDPQELHLEVGRPTKILVENRGEVEHEIEVLGMGGDLEEVVPWQGRAALFIVPRHVGRFPFICDRPGHLMRGMRGTIVVEEPRRGS